ncbi:endonuclease III [Bacteroidia bacterium]|nr:endonuclease III [Bacteroidia bacterium]
MTTAQRYKGVVAWFKKNVPAPQSELHYTNPYQLLVSVILSAQCTDKRVNVVTPALFAAFPTPAKMADASPAAIFEYIQSISYPNNKAKNLYGMATMLVNEFDAQLPHSIEDLQRLPGVGQKTANVVASILYNQPVIAVDTHVFRVAHRLGLVTKAANTPTKTEAELEKNIAPEWRAVAHHWLILHGRYICTARKPLCKQCGLTKWCKTMENGELRIES